MYFMIKCFIVIYFIMKCSKVKYFVIKCFKIYVYYEKLYLINLINKNILNYKFHLNFHNKQYNNKCNNILTINSSKNQKY